ncbi:MAG: metallopeptidase TldD-related protein [Gammaproteobacteria bacterium]|nr:metallopeptidase TldD-related protein [Gammaproteobacteria bacterium]
MKNTMFLSNTFVAAVALALLVPATAAGEDVLMQAMREELARTMDELRMEGMDEPYFVAYTIRDNEQVSAGASFGALLPSSTSRTRWLGVELRVGDASFDNTNFRGMGFFGGGGSASLPLTDDVVEIRRQIWLATDDAYKNALKQIAAKRAALQNETRVEDLGDLSPQEPYEYAEEPGAELPRLDEVEGLVRDLSIRFRDMPHIMDSRVGAHAARGRTYYVNSEGSSFIRSDPAAFLSVTAQTQADDGAMLHDFRAVHAHGWDDIANRGDLAAEVEAMGAAISERRSASALEDRYIGPVLFEGQAAAELTAQVLLPRLSGVRTPETERRFSARRSGNPFLDKLGARVLPRFMDLADDATLTGDGFWGGYPVDDDGVPAQATSLVENGILKTLLTTRNPVRGIDGSTGNRRGGGPQPSNLVMTNSRGMTREELYDELKLLMKEREAEYGIVVRRLGNPGLMPASGFSFNIGFGGPGAGQSNVADALVAYRFYPDGREELLRTVEFAGIADSVFKEIVAASDSNTIYTRGGSWGFASGLVMMVGGGLGLSPSSGGTVTLSVPDLLFEEMSVRNPTGNLPHPPVADHPFFEE